MPNLNVWGKNQPRNCLFGQIWILGISLSTVPFARMRVSIFCALLHQISAWSVYTVTTNGKNGWKLQIWLFDIQGLLYQLTSQDHIWCMRKKPRCQISALLVYIAALAWQNIVNLTRLTKFLIWGRGVTDYECHLGYFLMPNGQRY